MPNSKQYTSRTAARKTPPKTPPGTPPAAGSKSARVKADAEHKSTAVVSQAVAPPLPVTPPTEAAVPAPSPLLPPPTYFGCVFSRSMLALVSGLVHDSSLPFLPELARLIVLYVH